jgi:hypothetical protein
LPASIPSFYIRQNGSLFGIVENLFYQESLFSGLKKPRDSRPSSFGTGLPSLRVEFIGKREFFSQHRTIFIEAVLIGFWVVDPKPKRFIANKLSGTN